MTCLRRLQHSWSPPRKLFPSSMFLRRFSAARCGVSSGLAYPQSRDLGHKSPMKSVLRTLLFGITFIRGQISSSIHFPFENFADVRMLKGAQPRSVLVSRDGVILRPTVQASTVQPREVSLARRETPAYSLGCLVYSSCTRS